jgi:transcriptional regulator with XRE-family HTH domain
MGHYEAMRSHVVDPEALLKLRRDRGMSLRDLQLTTGLSWSFVKYVAKGERNLSDTTALLFSFALGVDINEFATPVKRTEGHSHAAA